MQHALQLRLMGMRLSKGADESKAKDGPSSHTHIAIIAILAILAIIAIVTTIA